jgi:hypothetical protein
MMTLFKPWRNGKQLKADTQSWDDVYNSHDFSLCEQEILKFFHIRYECADSRDNFRTQRKANDGMDFEGMFYTDEELQEFEDMSMENEMYGHNGLSIKKDMMS